MEIKSSCRSQFLVIEKEAIDMLQQGYSKKALYDYFKNQNKITMGYSSWLVVLRYQTKNKPFSIAQKKSNPEPSIAKLKNASIIKKGFHHDNTPYPSSPISNLPPKKELKVNIINKKTIAERK